MKKEIRQLWIKREDRKEDSGSNVDWKKQRSTLFLVLDPCLSGKLDPDPDFVLKSTFRSVRGSK
jgi:hypothetical protein